MPGADSPDIQALRNKEYKVDPTIAYRAAGAKRDLSNSFINPLGGYSTPQRDEAIRRSMGRRIDEQAGMESRAGQYDVNNLNLGKSQFLAGLTAPPLVQTGSSGTSSGSQVDKYKTPFSAKIMPALQTAAKVAAGGI